MPSWRDSILKHFQRGISRLTLVSDPDDLLTEETMTRSIRERGFEIVPFEDPIAFRYAYESEYRSAWDEGGETDLVVVLRTAGDLTTLPYDLLRAGRHLTFALHQLFPKLRYPVIRTLDRSRLDELFEAYQQHDGSTLGDRGTKEFVLTNCFEVVPKLIKTPPALLSFLLKRHYRQVRFPESLDELLLNALKAEKSLAGWPLETILHDRKAFLAFLQRHWSEYVDSLADKSKTCFVPFGHEDVRVYIDNMFLEGTLTPISRDDVSNLPKWVLTGVSHDAKANSVARFHGLIELLKKELPSQDATYREWLRVAGQWAELVVLRWECDEALKEADRQEWDGLHAAVESAFGTWALEHYPLLPNLPFYPQPVMLHHVTRFLAAERTKGRLDKVALLVIDGLSLDQWALLRRDFQAKQPDWRIEDSAVFAWVPTLTSVSRQSIFAAEPPLYFPDSFDRTDKERSRWCKFWEDQTGTRGIAELVKPVESANSPDLDAALSSPRLRVLGVVVNKVDEITHGMQLGAAGMQGQIRLWSAQGHISALVQRLLDEEFDVFLTSDHGNVAAAGIGTPNEGTLVEFKGKRARVYDTAALRDEVKVEYPQAVVWPGPGLPPNRHVLLAPGLKAFVGVGDLVVSHGGCGLEEVVVPFVRLSKDAHA